MHSDWPAWTNDVTCPWCGNTLLPLARMLPAQGGCPGCHRPVEWQFPDPMPLTFAAAHATPDPSSTPLAA